MNKKILRYIEQQLEDSYAHQKNVISNKKYILQGYIEALEEIQDFIEMGCDDDD